MRVQVLLHHVRDVWDPTPLLTALLHFVSSEKPPSEQPRATSVFMATGYPERLNFQCTRIYVIGMANSQSFYSLNLPAAAVFCHTNLMWSFTRDLFWKKTEIKLERGGRPAEIAFTFLGSKWWGKMCGEERSQCVKWKWMCLHRDLATDI